MKKTFIGSMGTLMAALFLAGCGGTGGSDLSASRALDASAAAAGQNQVNYKNDPNIVIPDSSVERASDAGKFMHTNHLLYVGPNKIQPNANPSGFSPAQIHSAYNVPSSGGSGVIVIVDAYDDKYALADFNAFSAQYGLPQETSTNVTASTNTVLQVVYAQGSKPRFNSGWSQEEDLDIEWAHAMAPSAKIVLVEAASNGNANLYAADDLAATISNAHQCSNSWSGGESSGESGSDSHFNHAGITYFFSSGDTGGARGYPPASPNVVAVGGTSLFVDGSGNRTNETGWSGSGGGPSSYESRPAYQSGISGIVGSARGIPDVSAVADPNTGVAVRWNGGWYVFGGTSVACPVIAGITNNTGANRGGPSAENTFIYGGLGGANYFDVVSGSAGSFNCAAGWDFVTGVGAPKGGGGL